MKKTIIFFFFIIAQVTFGQDVRIQQIKNNIEAIIPDSQGLSERVNVNIKEASLSSFLLAVSEVHKVNISLAPSLGQINIVNNFTNVTVGDLMVFLCKEYNLTIDFTGNILAIKPYEKPVIPVVPIQKIIDVKYDSTNDLISLNLKDDKLYEAFKK